MTTHEPVQALPHIVVSVMVTPAFITDALLREKALHQMLKHTAVNLPDLPTDQSWRIGPVEYVVTVVPREPDVLLVPHPLNGQHATEETVVALARQLQAAASEIDGSWVLLARASLVFDGQREGVIYCGFTQGHADPEWVRRYGTTGRLGGLRGDGRHHVLCPALAAWQVGEVFACDRDLPAMARLHTRSDTQGRLLSMPLLSLRGPRT